MTNKQKLFLLLVPFLFGLASCHQDDNLETVTAEISKIESSYVKGDLKEITFNEKVETKAPQWYTKRLYQEIDNFMNQRSEGRVYAAGDYDIGYIIYNNNTSCVNKITISMDNEDNSPATSWYSGSGDTAKPWEIPSGNITMTFCRVPGDDYFSSSYRYPGEHAVLRLGPLNVPGASSIIRYFDNEDSSNANYHIGTIAPNIGDQNTTLYFAHLPARTPGSFFFPLVEFGVFAARNDSYGQHYHYFIDDEDNTNNNYWVINGNYQSSWSGNPVMNGGVNTAMNILMFTYNP